MNFIIRIGVLITLIGAPILSDDHLKSAVNHLQSVARRSNTIFLQQETPKADDVIKEILLDLPEDSVIDSMINSLKNFPSVTPQVTNAENMISIFGEIHKRVYGMGSISDWSKDILEEEITRLAGSPLIEGLVDGGKDKQEYLNPTDLKPLQTLLISLINFNAPAFNVSLVAEEFCPVQKSLEAFLVLSKDSYKRVIGYSDSKGYSEYIEKIKDALMGYGSLDLFRDRDRGRIRSLIFASDLQDLKNLLELAIPSADETKQLANLQDMINSVSSDLATSLRQIASCDAKGALPDTKKTTETSKKINTIHRSLQLASTLFEELTGLLHSVSRILEDVLGICNSGKMEDFYGYKDLSKFQVAFHRILVKIDHIQKLSQSIKKEAEGVRLTDLDDYLAATKNFKNFFDCIQNPEIIQILETAKKIQDGRGSVEVGVKFLAGIKAAKEKVQEVDTWINGLPKADKVLPGAWRASQVMGTAVQGIANMWNALEQKSTVEKVLDNLKFLNYSEGLLNYDSKLDELITLEPLLQEMYSSLQVFQNSIPPFKTSSLSTYSTVFQSAKQVKGVKADFLGLAASVGKLRWTTSDPEALQKIEEVESSLKIMDTMGLDFAKFHDAFDAAGGVLKDLDVFYAKLIKDAAKSDLMSCPSCEDTYEGAFFNVDFSVIITTFSSTVAIIVIGYITCYNLFRPDLSENFDSVEMTTPIGLNYYRSIYEKILNHKKSLRSELPTPGEDFYAYFRDHFDFDSKVSSGPIANFMTEKHANFQRFNIPISMYTRVKLDKPGLLDDFIHANMVDYPSGLKLIMTQGPQASGNGKESDIERMWWMVKQENVEKIVMLCQLEENGVTQCDQYYPENEDEFVEFNDLKIICLKKEFEYGGQIVIRRLSVKFKGEKKYYVSHYQYIGWPEKENPQDLNMIYVLLYEIRTSWTPVIVHCSDGIGRTGCFGYIEMGYQTLKREEKMEFGDILDLMRFERAGVVLNAKQYGFCAFMIGYYILKDKVYYFDDDDDKAIFLFLKDGYNGWDEAENKSIQKKLRKKEREISRMSKKLKRT